MTLLEFSVWLGKHGTSLEALLGAAKKSKGFTKKTALKRLQESLGYLARQRELGYYKVLLHSPILAILYAFEEEDGANEYSFWHNLSEELVLDIYNEAVEEGRARETEFTVVDAVPPGAIRDVMTMDQDIMDALSKL